MSADYYPVGCFPTSTMAWCLRTEGALYLSQLLYASIGHELRCYDQLNKHLENGRLNSNSGVMHIYLHISLYRIDNVFEIG
jgi:hypothetical protein